MDLFLVSAIYSNDTSQLTFELKRPDYWWICIPISWLALDQLACDDLQRSIILSYVSCERDICSSPAPTKN